MKRWHLLHIGESQWTREPERIEVSLALTPSHDMTAYAIPGLLVLRAVGGMESPQEVYGIDPMSGETLWRFSKTDDDVLFFSCHVEQQKRIVATNKNGVFLLTRKGPQQLLQQALSPVAVGRLSPDGRVGFVLDDQQRLLIFDADEGKIKWSRRAPKGLRFGNPFPLDPERVCLATGGDIRCWTSDGTELWRWPTAQAKGVQYAIERFVQPDLLLIRANASGGHQHTTLQAETGAFIEELGDMWAYGADGVTSHPVPLFDGKQETIAFLREDGSCPAPQKIHKLIGGFRRLPVGCVALWYDALMKMVVATDERGDVAWKESYPDAKYNLAATYFGRFTAYFASTSGKLHIWDVGE